MENSKNTLAADTSLLHLRKEIDAIDDRILELLNQRAHCAQQVANIKTAAGEVDCFHRPEREAEVLRRIAENNRGPLSREAVTRFFRELMSECLALEKPLSVAFLGPEGTFTQQAAYKHFGHAIQSVPLPAIDEIFRAVESGACQYGVVPVENSTEGVITHTLDSFLRSVLLIAGEVGLRIHHNLMSKLSSSTAVREIFSHQQSLAQCREWLERYLPNVQKTAVSSNAEAARLAAVMPYSAAIAGEVAAELYELNILERNIEDEPDNTTRFLVVGRNPVGATGNDKTSLLLSTRNNPGALHSVLEPFARHGISMTKIESRPSRRGAWDYVFFVDVEGHRSDSRLAEALKELEESVTMLKILGSYPRASS
ncbi:prephenate dehydratase [Methylocaldum sp.]|uniref:prephenate dehydratase n=1 Tax=Methylocaldum sp. TaxID=1969727 RepID=UPI002D28D3A8|nr:prephenate dehydratase [Methylocaldum sp.]HYE34532.1 prephenate dehydratase [Methylocaldum sp.]